MTDQTIMEQEYVSFATKRHGDQKYGNQPYIHHLIEVANVLEDFGFISYKFQAAGYLHDVLEDTETTSGELIKLFGVEVAELVIACTGEGPNRKTRQANILYKLRYTPEACIVKCADRIVNIETGLKENNFDKLEMYKKEHTEFEEVVKPNVPETMWNRLAAAIDSIDA